MPTAYNKVSAASHLNPARFATERSIVVMPGNRADMPAHAQKSVWLTINLAASYKRFRCDAKTVGQWPNTTPDDRSVWAF